MKKSNLRLPPLLTVSLLLAALAAVLQTIAVLNNFEMITGYFDNRAILPTVATVIALCSALVGTVSAFREKPEIEQSIFFSRPVRFSVAPVFFLCFVVILLTPEFRSMRLAIPALPFLLAATVYSALIPLPQMRKHKNALSLLGFCAVIACILLNTYLYFDMSIPMNAPLKTALQTGLLCSMLSFVAELRYLLDLPQPRVFRMLATWTVASSALVFPALPMAWSLTDYPRNDHVALSALVAFCAIGAVISLFAIFRPRSNNQKTETDEQVTDSSERTPQ